MAPEYQRVRGQLTQRYPGTICCSGSGRKIRLCSAFPQASFIRKIVIAKSLILFPLLSDCLLSLFRRKRFGSAIRSPRRKAQGCGGQDSVDGGHGHQWEKLAVIFVRIDYRIQTIQGFRSEAHFCVRAVYSIIFCLRGSCETPHRKLPNFLAGFIRKDQISNTPQTSQSRTFVPKWGDLA